MARYKYSENTKEVTDIYFDTETHGEFMGMEQGGKMKKVSLPLLQDKIVEEITGDLNSHEADTTNPHEVTKEQVGLDEVDNTSDADKPVSTAQRNAINELAGTGRTTETVKQNADDIATKESIANVNTLKGAGWAGETVKKNADDISTLKADDATEGSIEYDIKQSSDALKGPGYTEGSLKSHEDRLDTLEGTGEGSVAKAIDDAVSPLEEDITDHETRIELLEGFNPLQSWADIQTAVRSGVISKYLSVGDQLVATYNGVEKVWDIIGIDHDTPTDTDYTHSLTIQSQDILRNGMISAPEAMYNAVTELPAGMYIFTMNGVQYTFTSTQAVPAGGVIYIKTRSEYVPLTLTIYGADRTSIIEDDITVTTTSGTDNLTPINDYIRTRYGNNNYPISALRQWLNSESATFAWTPLGLYDMPSSYSTQGFLNILDPDLKAVIGAVDKQVALATYDGGGQELFSDKVFLLSRVEVDLGGEGVATGESVYDFWSGASNADRIKGSPKSWWLRSPAVLHKNQMHTVGTSGDLDKYTAIISIGLSPACVIY